MRLLLAPLLLLFALPTAAPPPAAAALPVISHVVVVAMENHSRSQVIGNSSAPYITSLARTYGEATNYQNLAHPSLPNYMAVTGGSTSGVTNDCAPSASCGSNGASIFSQVAWKSYQESMPKACDKANASPYFVKHNPAAYYRTLTGCTTGDLAFPATPNLSAAYTFITPNACHDMHSNTCSGSGNVVAQGDAFLKAYIPKLLATTTYKAGTTAIFIWFDEGSSNNILPFIVISPYTHGVVDTAAMNHYSLLRTTETLLGKPCIAASCNATSFATAFGL